MIPQPAPLPFEEAWAIAFPATGPANSRVSVDGRHRSCTPTMLLCLWGREGNERTDRDLITARLPCV